jgi:CDP-diglyceride synthetase
MLLLLIIVRGTGDMVNRKKNTSKKENESREAEIQTTVEEKESNLYARVKSALVLIPLVLGVIIYGGLPFVLAISFLCFAMNYEFFAMLRRKKMPHGKVQPLLVFGVIYCSLPCLMLVALRMQPYDGLALVLWLLLAVWSTDTGAYFAGKKIGGPKIAPAISPNKTWAGIAGGMLLSTLVSIPFYFFHDFKVFEYNVLLLAPIITIVAQMGDFIESYIKRYFGVKDSGNLIPGHGGVLDRVDGLITSTIMIYLLY